MNYKNGYKVVYEVAANGERAFYASKSNIYPNRDENGNITDAPVASFKDADFAGKTIYEYKGKFYVSANRLPKFNEAGAPDVANGERELNFDVVLVEKPATTETTTAVEPEVTNPATTEEPNAGETEVNE